MLGEGSSDVPFRRRVVFGRLGVRGSSALVSSLALLACQVDSSSNARDGSPPDPQADDGKSPDAQTGGGGARANAGGAPSSGRGGEPSRGGANASGGTTTDGGTQAGGAGQTGGAGGSLASGATAGTFAGGAGGQTGGAGGAQTGALFFDDFLGSSIDSAKWAVFDRISDQANGEINCCTPANVSVSGGFLNGVSKHEDHTCGDTQMSPITLHYTSWQIQQKLAPFLYGTVEVRAKVPGGTGIWPDIWMLGFEWQATQADTANTPNHQWPKGGWCEIDIAEFWQNERSAVNCTVHFDVPGGLHLQPLPFDAASRFMIYRLEWRKDSLLWSVDPEDSAGFRTLRSVTGPGNVPDVPMYVVINAAVGGTGGGTPDPSTFPQTFEVDWVRITQ